MEPGANFEEIKMASHLNLAVNGIITYKYDNSILIVGGGHTHMAIYDIEDNSIRDTDMQLKKSDEFKSPTVTENGEWIYLIGRYNAHMINL